MASELRQRQRGGDGVAAPAASATTSTSGESSNSSSPNTSKKKKPRVVIVGGGPAGAAIAKSLADMQFYQVELFEAYPHPDQMETNSPKAYVIALSGRGQAGIQSSTGICPSDITGSVVSKCIVRHPKNRPIDHADKPALIVPRKDLTLYLLQQAQAAGAQIHFQQRLVGMDVEKRVAVFESTSKSQQQKEVAYDLLIGADGSNSRVRALLNEQADDFSVERTEVDSMEYQVVTVMPRPTPASSDDGSSSSENNSRVFPNLPATAVHAWNDATYNSICLAFPLHSGGTLFAIVFPQGRLEEFQQQHAQSGGHGYDDALHCLLPDVMTSERVQSEIVQQLLAGKPANGGLCVWTNSLGSAQHGVVLVGDSGHGMWPSLGQGANCALESVAVFCQAMRAVEDILVVDDDNDDDDKSHTLASWSRAVVREFNARRLEDARAAVDLTYGGIGARKSRGRGNAPLSFKLQVAGMMLLNIVTAGLVPKPALIRILTGEADLSYAKARRYNFYYEKAICLGVGAGIACGSAYAFFRYRR